MTYYWNFQRSYKEIILRGNFLQTHINFQSRGHLNAVRIYIDC